MTTLINFSGGLDSTYCLYKFLKQNPEDVLLVHHCSIKNHEGRDQAEYKAVSRILAWMKQNCLTNFRYLQSGYDYGNLGYIVKDKEVIGFNTGVILRNPRHASIKKVIISSSAEDVSNTDYYKKSEQIRFDIINAVARRPIQFLYPIIDKSRLQMMVNLPKDLLDLIWYCRRPVNGIKCGSCKTCKQVIRDENILSLSRKSSDSNLPK